VVNAVVWRKQPVFDWPLMAAVHAIAGLLDDSWAPIDGAYFAGDDAAALRRMRAKTAASELNDEHYKPSLVYVRDCGQTYALNLRDELPASVEERLRAFVAAGWKRPTIASCIKFADGTVPLTPCPPE
jgi:hypothetical protein